MHRLRGGHGAFVAVLIALAAASLLLTSPAVGVDNAIWGTFIIANTPVQIWASSHFGQVLDYLVFANLRRIDGTVTAFTAMGAVSYAMGLVYLAGLAVMATTLPRGRRIAFLVVGAASPITVFLHGEEEIPYYPYPLLVLAVALYRRWTPEERRRRGSLVAALGGLAAAFHGGGLFFLPGILALRVAAESAPRAIGTTLRAGFDAGVAFFGPTGALFVFYVLTFPGVAIVPGDAGGGGQQRLFVPLFGEIPAYHEFRAYSFFSGTHLAEVLAISVMGAPALWLLAAAAIPRGRELAALIRADAALWILAGCGLAFATFFYAGVSILITQSILVPILSLAQVLALVTLAELDGPLWRRLYPLLLALTVAATAFDWLHAGANAPTWWSSCCP